MRETQRKMLSVFKESVGRRVSRAEALRICRRVMEEAEARRERAWSEEVRRLRSCF